MNYEWNIDKNSTLKDERDVCFEDVVVELNAYTYMVPFIKKENSIFLKTIIPSRKMKKLYKR